ncbi:MAG: (Fe-S)-binding protein, partial [Nitrososphaerales archaeon]
VLIASIPFTKLWHIIVGPIQILRRYSIGEKPIVISFGKKLSKPFDLRKLLETESFEVKIGIKTIKDMSWRQRISLEPCIRCGRCQDSCPAYAAGRELSPMEVVLNLNSSLKLIFISDILNFMAHVAKWLNFKNYISSLSEKSEKLLLLNGKLKDETVWSCTTCGACVAICPVDISNFEPLIERRRFLVTEGKLDSIKMDILKNLIEKSNPYGMPISDRDLWMKNLSVKTLKENPNPEYLYWVGCSSSYDKRNQNIAKSMVNILNKAGVNFVVLGLEERCCGDTLRRMGDEGRFQELALANIEVLKSYNVKKIITHCPHCYNTLKNEYKEFGGDFEVIHHSEFLLNLLKMGKIKLIKVIEEETLYHDPCYLGRYNGIYDAPRILLQMISNLKVKEFEKHHVNSFCCGGGGGNVWYEVPEKEKMSVLRIKEAEKIGVNLISVACPYCITMLEDALKTKGLEGKIKIKDIAETLSEVIGE